MTVPTGFFENVCSSLGFYASPGRLRWFNEWAKWEGTAAAYNPLATTQDWPNATVFNSSNVRNYATFADGVGATVKTLTNGYYPLVLQSLKEERVVPGVSANIRTWGTTGFADVLDAGWTAWDAAPSPAPTDSATDAILRALTGRTGQDALNTLSAWNKTPLGAYTGYSLIDGYWARKADIEAVTKAVKDLASGTVSADAIIAGLQEILKRAQQQGVKV